MSASLHAMSKTAPHTLRLPELKQPHAPFFAHGHLLRLKLCQRVLLPFLTEPNARNPGGKLKQPLIKMLRPCDEKIVRQWSPPPLLIFGGALRAAPPCLVAVAWLSLFQRFQKRNGVRGSPFAGHSTIPLLPPEQRRRSPLRAHRPADTA